MRARLVESDDTFLVDSDGTFLVDGDDTTFLDGSKLSPSRMCFKLVLYMFLGLASFDDVTTRLCPDYVRTGHYSPMGRPWKGHGGSRGHGWVFGGGHGQATGL